MVPWQHVHCSPPCQKVRWVQTLDVLYIYIYLIWTHLSPLYSSVVFKFPVFFLIFFYPSNMLLIHPIESVRGRREASGRKITNGVCIVAFLQAVVISFPSDAHHYLVNEARMRIA